MKFGVIYSVDVGLKTNLREFAPPRKLMHLFEVTEDQSRYSVASDLFPKHRKYASKRMLTRAEFDEFVEHCGLWMSKIETMGILGAPWAEVGFSCPAFSFDNDDPSAYQNAYVVPVPTVGTPPEDEEEGMRLWRRIEKAMLAVYGSTQSVYTHKAWRARYDRKQRLLREKQAKSA